MVAYGVRGACLCKPLTTKTTTSLIQTTSLYLNTLWKISKAFRGSQLQNGLLVWKVFNYETEREEDLRYRNNKQDFNCEGETTVS